MLNTILCEDNKTYADFLKNIIHSYFSSHPQKGSFVFSCSSYDELQDFTSKNHANVFFLDIHLNSHKTGLDLAEEIRQKDDHAYIIFISQYTQNVFQSFQVKPFDFIPKPVTQEYIEDLLERIYKDYLKNKEVSLKDSVIIKLGPEIHHLYKNQIYYIEKESNKCIFHSENSQVYCYDTLETIMRTLKSSDFLRVHRSFIVNKNYIQKIDLKALEITLQNHEKCFIGRKYKNILLNLILPQSQER